MRWSVELEKIKELIDEFDVMAVGEACPYEGKVKYMVTYHPTDIPMYKKKREILGGSTNYTVIGHLPKPGVDMIEPHVPPTGSSALLGVSAGIRLGYTKIILCGCPMEGANKGGFQPYDHFQKGWVARKKEVEPYVRSMSGWTKQLLGEPTKEWLNQ
jgi:hypothetical protein